MVKLALIQDGKVVTRQKIANCNSLNLTDFKRKKKIQTPQQKKKNLNRKKKKSPLFPNPDL